MPSAIDLPRFIPEIRLEEPIRLKWNKLGIRAILVSFYDFEKEHMWADEVARRVSEKHKLDVKFEIDYESGFVTTFDSTRMSDEQLIDEIVRRVDAIAEAREMILSKKMMNEFLVSKGIEEEAL